MSVTTRRFREAGAKVAEAIGRYTDDVPSAASRGGRRRRRATTSAETPRRRRREAKGSSGDGVETGGDGRGADGERSRRRSDRGAGGSRRVSGWSRPTATGGRPWPSYSPECGDGPTGGRRRGGGGGEAERRRGGLPGGGRHRHAEGALDHGRGPARAARVVARGRGWPWSGPCPTPRPWSGPGSRALAGGSRRRGDRDPVGRRDPGSGGTGGPAGRGRPGRRHRALGFGTGLHLPGGRSPDRRRGRVGLDGRWPDPGPETIAGAGRLLQETGEEPETLRAQVTSPGGTTEAGVGRLEAMGCGGRSKRRFWPPPNDRGR